MDREDVQVVVLTFEEILKHGEDYAVIFDNLSW